MAYTFDDETSTRRFAAYSDFLLAAYGTDSDGLADLAGVSREDMAEYLAETDCKKLNASVVQKLGFLTGISFSWLFAEKVDGAEVPATIVARTYAPHIDELNEAVTKVKACAAAMAALYIQDSGYLTYDRELFEVLSGQLHEAARCLDRVLETL